MTLATRASFTGAFGSVGPGTWTPDGTPATIDAGAGYKAFPGVAWLDATHLLLVYRYGTNHLEGGDIVGRIGTVTGTSVSWAAPFTIHSHATLDVRCDDGVSVIGTSVVIVGRYYTGTQTIDPFVLVCDDPAASLASGSTWTQHLVAFTEGTDFNQPTGYVLAVDGGYALGVFHDVGAAFQSGVLLNDSLTDWSAPTYVAVTGTGYTEICLDTLRDGSLLALLRKEADDSCALSRSYDEGATWSAPAAAHDGYGLPMFRRLTDNALLTVYRDSPAGDTAWRVSLDHGVSWGSETILDTTGTESMYATLAQFDYSHVLCIYAVEVSATDADIYSQVFTRS